MTNEEAQQLIAEIKDLPAQDRYYVETNKVEKIINRFANKPPYESGAHSALNDLNRLIILDLVHSCKYGSDNILLNITNCEPIYLGRTDLTDLRDNIIKLLAWLEYE